MNQPTDGDPALLRTGPADATDVTWRLHPYTRKAHLFLGARTYRVPCDTLIFHTGYHRGTARQMTESNSRGIPGRIRAPRTEGFVVPTLLKAWADTVGRVEAGMGTDALASGCPRCDATDGLDARDQLGALIRRGGRRGRRVTNAVKSLDERFEKATTPSPFAPQNLAWWRRRNLD